MKSTIYFRRSILRYTVLVVYAALILSLSSIAIADEKRIYQVSPSGQIQYHKPSFIIQKDGRIIESDQSGQKMYNRRQYQVKDERVYPVDSAGNIEYHKKHLY